MSTRKRWLGLGVVVAVVWLPLCEAGDKAPPARKSFDPAWGVTRAPGGQVRHLVARARRWKPEALADLQGLDSLELLDLSGTVVGDDELRAIAPLRSLKTLLLARTAVSDAAVARLAGLVELETLDLSDTRVSDEGLRHLHGLGKLKRLVTHRSRVTEQGLEALESLRPGFEAVRLWDVSWEQFDHALLLRTPRFNLIQDYPYMAPGVRKNGHFQISGPTWKLRSRGAAARGNRKPNRRGSRKPEFRIVCHVEPGYRGISSVTVADTTLKVSNPTRTYVVDGHGKLRLAGFTLRYDDPSWTWLETPLKPAIPSDATPKGPSSKKTAQASPSLAGSDRRAPSANYRALGEWNGKLVWGLVDAERSHTGPLPFASRINLKYRSDAGVVVVFLHIPCTPIAYDSGRQSGFSMACGACGGSSGRWDFFGPFQPSTKYQHLIESLKSPARVFPRYLEGHWYHAKGGSPQTRRFGSGCTVSVGGARGRGVYLGPFPRPTSPIPRWEEFARKQCMETHLHDSWPDVRVEKRGRELVIRLGLDGAKQRAELVDWLGRNHVLEPQRIDLAGPKKTIVLDVYGRLRVLRPEDAERILRTRLRDYLDNGDPSPAGPVAPVAAAR